MVILIGGGDFRRERAGGRKWKYVMLQWAGKVITPFIWGQGTTGTTHALWRGATNPFVNDREGPMSGQSFRVLKNGP